MYNEAYKNNVNKEWVYDIIIYSWNKVFDEVYLVGEIEWNSDYESIEYDFLKLIFARSKVRLMIYQVFINNYEKHKNNLINIIEKPNSCLKGDIYLFVRSKEEENNQYFQQLKDSSVWTAFYGEKTYDEIKRFTGFDLKNWISRNVDWENDLNKNTIKQFEHNDLLKYLAW